MVSTKIIGNLGQWRTEGRGGVWGFELSQNSGGPPKSCQTQPDFIEFRKPTPQDVRKN